MPHLQNINIQEEDDLRKTMELVIKNYRFFVLGLVIALSGAFFINRYSIPIYSVSSSILINPSSTQKGNENDFLYSNVFGGNLNFQNELWIINSYHIVENTVKNLDLSVSYLSKGKFNYYEVYKTAPFIVNYSANHAQPIDVIINISILNEGYFTITAESKKVYFYNFEKSEFTHSKVDWSFTRNGKFGELIETPDLAFIIEPRDTTRQIKYNESIYGFRFRTTQSLSSGIKSRLEFTVVDKLATVIKINLRSESPEKGVDILNELMNVYSEQNLERKNHLATITIDYIEKQLNEISDSLTLTEDNLQNFRTSKQLLDITNQATGLAAQRMDLENQLAELVSSKRYYDYLSDLLKNDNFSNMMLPASIGISDQFLNDLVSELINAQAQRSNLIENNQERNPMVQKLKIQIENLKKTISETITALGNTTSISIDEMNKRIRRVESEINRLPATQRQLGIIERKYRLNDAIVNYLMEKRAEAKITKASNLPDDIIVEPAKSTGAPISPNKRRNYLIAFVLGLSIPFGFIWTKNAMNNKIESNDDIERITDHPLLGKILHNRYKTENVMFEFPKSNIAESFRALRTNLDFYVRGGQKKVIMITSCLENEGKSFVALNIAMSYAQLGRRTILVDFDLRKSKAYFEEGEKSKEGLSSYMIDKANLNDLITKSPHDKLDYLIAGIIPPNPIELLALDKTEIFLNKLKDDYDIIVMDTTPLAQVSDAYLLIGYADLILFTVRSGQTFKKVFTLIMKDLHQKNVHNVCLVLNDNKLYGDQYGYGYGYYNRKGFFKKKVRRRKHMVSEVSSK